MKKLNKTQIETLVNENLSFDEITEMKESLNINTTAITKILDFVSISNKFVGLKGTAAALKQLDLTTL